MTWFSPGSGPGPGAERWLAEMRQDEEEPTLPDIASSTPTKGTCHPATGEDFSIASATCSGTAISSTRHISGFPVIDIQQQASNG